MWHALRTPQRTGAAALAGLLLLVGVVVTLHVRAYATFSPIDELHHADYMIKAAHGQLLRRGDVMGPETRREGACRGVDPTTGFGPFSCDDETWLEGREFNTEEIQPPAYYVITGWTARALRPLIGTASLVTAGRMVGVVWLGLGLAAVWAALSILGVPVLGRLAAGALLATTPVVLHASATVTDDATALLAGAGVLLAALAWEARRVPALVVIVAAAVGVSFRLTNFAGCGVVVLYLVVRSIRPRAEPDGAAASRPPRSLLLMAGAVVATVAITGVAWVGLNSAMARVGPLANPNTLNQQACCLPLDAVLGQVDATVTPARDPYLVPFLQNNKVRVVVKLTDWLLLGTAVGLAALSSRGSRGEALAAAAIVCMLATGPLLTVTNYVFEGEFYGIPPRYGLSLMPALAACLALSMEKAWVRACVVSLASVSVLMTLVLELR